MLAYLTSKLHSLAKKRGKGLAARFATSADYSDFGTWLKSTAQPAEMPSETSVILSTLEREGILILDGFWSAEKCATARLEIDRLIQEYPKYVNGNAKADVRIYGANNASPLIEEFAQDPQLLQIANAYNRKATRTAFTLAAKMPTTEGNNGSGEGWHRDAFLRQFKAIIYLSDVASENGPFQFVQNSHRRTQLLSDMKNGKLAYMQYRIKEEQIESILKPDPDRIKSYIGKAGTLILVDTSAIHRGKPIQAGTRYALTNYYFPDDAIDQSMYEKFDVLPRP